MKKPSPWMAMSVGVVLIWIVPWLKLGVMSATIVPRPSCRGFVPPVESLGGEPRLCVWRNCVANEASEDLKPTVFELARLLPTTSIVVSAALRPVNAVLARKPNP